MSSPLAFTRLAPFIQEFIWKNGWTELRDIQARAIEAALDTDKHLLLAAGTASGKTEAAFLPVLTELHERPSSSVGALYIGPLKALINDQFLRLTDLCTEAGIAVTPWHGDIGAGPKRALLREPSGILQITPEALEGLLLNKPAGLANLFGDLRWVVIDEIHAFMGTDRGGQVLSLLDRLKRFANDKSRLPRRIGLSATLGDYGEAAAWLAGGDRNSVEVIADSSSRTVFLLVDFFVAKQAVEQEDDSDAKVYALLQARAELFRTAFDATRHRKSLIFTNRRADAEEMIAGLRRIAERAGDPDIFHVHHGSIAGALREAAEEAMRDPDRPACTAATVTLELGIDLGQLDRVLQLGPTSTVASFLQRLGRAGRRGQRPEMLFLLSEDPPAPEDTVLDRVPWDLLQAIAIIQLYAEERWIEPIRTHRLPTSLLYQQTMSVLGAAGEIQPAQLAERVLTLAPFKQVTQDDFRELLLHLIEIDHIERSEQGGLILGLAGERVVRDYRFLATFADNTEWSVKDGTRDVGTVADEVPVGETLSLAGRTWTVTAVIEAQKLLVVRRVKGATRSRFVGGEGPDIHDRVVERMRRVLLEVDQYPYLTPRAAARLGEARELARIASIADGPSLVALGDSSFALLPWRGRRAVRTLAMRLQSTHDLGHGQDSRFYLEFNNVKNAKAHTASELMAVLSAPWTDDQAERTLKRASLIMGKYDEFVPDELLRRAFLSDAVMINAPQQVRAIS